MQIFANVYSVTCATQDYVIAEGPPPFAIAGVTTLRVGANNNNGSLSGRNAVLIFSVPALLPGEKMTSANLTANVAGKSGSPTFNADLWGIGFQTNTSSLLEYFEADSGDAGNVKLHDNIITPSISSGNVVCSTAALTNYLQNFYTTNVNYTGGAYIFFRFNPDANAGTNSIGWSLSAAESTNAAVLTITTTVNSNVVINTTNFIVIITDDQRFDSLGVVQREMGSAGRFPWFTNGTPNIDRLAAEGIRFRNGYVTLSLCSPSRASILTGKYNHNNGIINNSTAFPTNSVTWATQLRTKGYVTGMVGKWHMGSQVARPGFDFSASFIGQGNYFDNAYYVNGVSTATTGWVDDVSTDFALNFIETNRFKNFALMLGYKSTHAPHTPPDWATNLYSTSVSRDVPNLTVPPPYRTNIAANSENAKRVYHRCLTAMDAGVGRILDRLDQLGITTNTMIIFLGDNGFYLGEHGLGDKRSLYEESFRVPLVVRYPRMITNAMVRDEFALNIDIAPTILDLAGVAIPSTMQGRSWRPLLNGSLVTNWRQSFVGEYVLESGYAIPTTVSVRMPGAKMTLWPGQNSWSEMFDLTTDRYEVTNLFNTPAFQAKRNELQAELNRLVGEVGLMAKMADMKRTNNTFQFSFSGGIGPNYQLEKSTNLQTWSVVSTNKMTSSTMSATVTNATAGKEFYRLNWIGD